MERVELYEVPGGFGLRVLMGDSIVLDQPFKPGEQGFVVMTQAEAQAEGDRFIGRPRMGYATTRITASSILPIDMQIGPVGYAGAVQWYENDTLLGEVNCVDGECGIDYTPDTAGPVTIKAGNEQYGYATVTLEVVE